MFIESQAAQNSVGIVKLVGGHSGFIACYAALSVSGADVVLIPEVPFALDGEGGLLAWVDLRRRVSERGHAVVVVAEGASEDLIACHDEGLGTRPAL